MFPKVEGPTIYRQSAYEGGNVVCPAHRPLLPQETSLVLISSRGWVDPRAILRPEGLCQRKVPITPIWSRTPTFRLVAQCLIQLRHRVTPSSLYTCYIAGGETLKRCGGQVRSSALWHLLRSKRSYGKGTETSRTTLFLPATELCFVAVSLQLAVCRRMADTERLLWTSKDIKINNKSSSILWPGYV